MSDTPRNPPAFPYQHNPAHGGMYLRDWLAGQALAQSVREIWSEHEPEDVAKRCYHVADAMLKVRES